MLDWDQLAPAYGRQLWLERSAIRSLLDLLDVRSDERLLDLATGPATVLGAVAVDDRLRPPPRGSTRLAT